ncbi:hypothetical protein [Dyadobacter sp. CY323]|uniref:hypothetical protein n=1 Tax=Dyadobacter sp. CY323 TaxID=2907302 RepID=UPI001F317DF1|nr:hypothetical protein [Dyadobacter sp. CY323]MCE6987548.1 hypothetical protein [Dyadobacter sp. CY323]
MANITNQHPSGKVEAGSTLTVSGVESENEAILAVENYLRVNQKEGLELAIKDQTADGDFEIKLEKAGA